MYGGTGAGVVATSTAAVVLPNTGSSQVMLVATSVVLAVGAIVTLTSLARLTAKRGQ